jgi:hypothetical protein
MLMNGVTAENPAPVDEDNTEEALEESSAAEVETETESTDAEAEEPADGEEKANKKPARAKGKKTMSTKGKKTAAKGGKKTAAKKTAPKGKKTVSKKNGNGARSDSKMSQAVAFMKAERAKLEDPKAPPRGFRKELIERTAKKFGLAVATCSTQYGAKVGA